MTSRLMQSLLEDRQKMASASEELDRLHQAVAACREAEDLGEFETAVDAYASEAGFPPDELLALTLACIAEATVIAERHPHTPTDLVLGYPVAVALLVGYRRGKGLE